MFFHYGITYVAIFTPKPYKNGYINKYAYIAIKILQKFPMIKYY